VRERVDRGAVRALSDGHRLGHHRGEAAVLDGPVLAAVDRNEHAEIGAEVEPLAAGRIDGE
jgi:hypothetical protein